MAANFFFYDLETTGVRWRDCRIMQFAGQRTDMDLQPIGEPFNLLVKLTPDMLPDPEAVLLTGVTPQQTLTDGLTEYEFLQVFETEVAMPDTVFVGYNNVRFDDEFIRCMRYRNFYDPYDWTWRDGRSRWDLLDLIRMTRALRPDGIEWPFADDGKPTNRLELITKLNGLDHQKAHDALNDVQATIAVAKLIRDKQPKLFDWLFKLRNKSAVKDFIAQNRTFVYSSGKYDNDCQKTAVVYRVWTSDERAEAIVYDLRHDPEPFAALSPEELVERWRYSREENVPPRLPAKTLKYNRCPAICPSGLIGDEAVQKRLCISLEQVEANRKKLDGLPDFRANIVQAKRLMDEERQAENGEDCDVDEQTHGGFLDQHDQTLERAVRAAEPAALSDFIGKFHDARMNKLLPRFKARNFPASLTDEERAEWEAYRKQKLFDGGQQSRLAQYFDILGKCAQDPKYADKQFVLEELQLYGQSLLPGEFDE